jgi:dTDP-4-amino-4,6-dideoxygalactose transaminase
MSLPVFKPSFRVDECMEQVKECLEKGWTGLGYKTVEFETQWKEYTGLPYAHFLNSATSGLHLAMYILKQEYGWGDNAEVISTPLTFVSTNHAILYENLKVRFADVDKYMCLDPKSVVKQITENTKAVVFVGIGGNIGQFHKIVDICKEHDLALILDGAHMAGTRYNGSIVGKDADAIIYSYQAVKNLPTADSGMICFKDKKHDELARKLAWLGINKDTFARTSGKGAYKWKYDVEDVGFKYHGNSIMAGIAMVQLKYLDKDNAYRRQLATWYDQGFAGSGIKVVPVTPDCESSRHLYMILVDNRDRLIMALNDVEIYPGVHYRTNTEYKMYSHGKKSCKKASKYSEQLMSLPMHMSLTKEDIDYIVTQVKGLS